jgi:hypothetical protein
VAQATPNFYILDMDGGNVSPERMARITGRFLELYAGEEMRVKSAKETAPRGP